MKVDTHTKGFAYCVLVLVWLVLVWWLNAISCDIRAIDDVPDDDGDEVVMAETVEEIVAKTEAHADQQALDLKPESELHVQGIILRLYRLEALLARASKYVPRYDDDGHKLPLKEVIDTELGTMA